MKLKKHACSNCKRVAHDSIITHFQYVNDNCYAIRFTCSLCGVGQFQLLTKAQLDKIVSK